MLGTVRGRPAWNRMPRILGRFAPNTTSRFDKSPEGDPEHLGNLGVLISFFQCTARRKSQISRRSTAKAVTTPTNRSAKFTHIRPPGRS